MAGFKTDYLSKKFLDWVFGKQSYTPPDTVYCALSTTTPLPDGTNFTEPAGANYSRLAVANNVTNFPGAAIEAAKETVHCAIAIVFPTTNGAWGTITWAGWFEAASGGNMIDAGPLTIPLVVNASNMQVSFPADTGFTGTES